MADYVVRLTGQDNLSGTIKNVKSAVADLGNSASNNLSKFSEKFEKISNSTAPLKRQLRDLKALMADMNFQGLTGTDEFTKIAQYAGQVKDAMDDASAATKRFADDTFTLKAVTEGVQGIAAAASIATGAMGMFGVENEKVKEAILKVQSAMAILNGVQQVANILNKDSALMQALKAAKLAITTTATTANTTATIANTVAEGTNTTTTATNTVATTANTVAEGANTVATTVNTAAQKASNVAKAIGKALIGDYSGLLLVGIAAIVGTTTALAANTDTQNENNAATDDSIKAQKDIQGTVSDSTKKIKENTAAIKINKEEEKDWSNKVTQNASNQIAAYTRLQLKWQECNRDQKLREKFQKEYGDEVNRVAGKVKQLSEYEDFFVNDTDKVVNAILARAAAEAGAQKYADAIIKKAENDRNGSVQNGRYYYNVSSRLDAGVNSATGAEIQAYERATGRRAITGGGGQSGKGYVLTDDARNWVTNQRKQSANIIKGQDQAEIDYWAGYTKQATKRQHAAEKAAGMGSGYEPPKAFSGGGSRNSNSHGSSSHGTSGTDKKDEQQPLAQSLDWLRAEKQKLEKQLSMGLVPDDKIAETKEKIEYLKKDIENKEIELGFKVKEQGAAKGSITALEKELQQLQDKLKKGLIPDSEIDTTQKKIEQLQKDIKAKKIELKFEDAPITDYEKQADDFKTQLKDLNQLLTDYKQQEAAMAKYNADLEAYNKALAEYNRELEEAKKKEEDFTPSVDNNSEALAELQRQYNEGKITLDEFIEAQEKLNIQLEEVVVKAMAKAPVKPKIPVKPQLVLGNEIVKQYTDVIAAIDKRLQEDNLTVRARIELANTRDELQQKANEISKGKITIPAEITPTYIEKGKEWDKRKSYENAQAIINRIKSDFEHGIIDRDEANKEVAEINHNLKELEMEPIVIHFESDFFKIVDDIKNAFSSVDAITGMVSSFDSLTKAIDEDKGAWEIFKASVAAAESVISTITAVMSTLHAIQDTHNIATQKAAVTNAENAAALGSVAAAEGAKAVVDAAAVEPAMASAVALQTQAAAAEEAAAANMFAAHSSIPFVGAALGAASVGIMEGVLSSIKAVSKFANGGIVGGSSYSGDKLFARVNSGEMILNGRQQKNLFNAIDNNRLGSSNAQSISFKIKGSDLYGTLKNYSKIKGKSGVTTGIK